MGQNVLILIYSLIVIVAVGISGFLSYYGFLSTFGQLSLPFTILIVLVLIGADILMSMDRKRGRALGRAFALFIVGAIFSGASNFNFLYTNFMKDDVTEATLRSQYAIFRDNLVETRSTLSGMDAVQFAEEKRVELDRELAALRTQINDELRPGCGERCREHLATIEGILGKQLTDLAIPPIGSSRRLVNDWYDRVRTAAVEDFNTSMRTNKFPEIAGLISRIDDILLKYDSPERALASGEGLTVLEDIARISEEVEREANALLPVNSEIDHTRIDPTLGRLGEIVYSFQNGFLERPNLGATIMALVLAVIVDLIPVIFALTAFRPERSGQVMHPNTGRGRAGRGKVIT